MQQIKVKLKNNSYTVYTGAGILGRIGSVLKNKVKGDRVLIVSNKKVYRLYGKKVKRSLSKYFYTFVYLMPDGEKYKTPETVGKIYAACAKNHLDRYSTIVALGGGVAGDTAGFAAATYMRGINIVQVPTSLVAQVDSSVGGKTGVDLKAGKNLAGVFYQPLFVLADVSTLKTLNRAEFENGMAEVIKHGIIRDKKYFEYITKNRDRIMKRDPRALLRVVKGSVEIKAAIVERDEKERTGLRAVLNYGHTAGHAIEAEAGYYYYKHGQAVSIGMAVAASLAYKMGYCTKDCVKSQIKALNSFNLIKPLKKVKIANVLKRLYHDKKVKNRKIRFVLTKKIGRVIFIENIKTNKIKAELERYNDLKRFKEEVLYG